MLIDFLVEQTFVEKNTFAYIHHLESQTKAIQAVLNQLQKHGLVTMIEMKLDKFKSEYSPKLGLSLEEFTRIFSTESNIKPCLYYFHVDLKFILKARLHLLKKHFEENVSKTRQVEGQTYQCDKCDFGRMKDNIYSEV